MLSLMVAAVVILLLQPTGTGGDFVINSPFVRLVGRLEILWRAYLTLFSDSLGTLSGFAESLKFATPLIMTGLAVAFGFQAGLFNIGAPGQMVLGAVFAMLAGLYMPGPRFVVVPVAILAAALGGGLWGAIPGWLKARFGANEVINTILLNYVAASILLFSLSSSLAFASAALRILQFLGVLALIIVVLGLIPALRLRVAKAPRLVFAVIGVIALVGMVVVGLPRAGDGTVVLNMPFKAPGSEPKSYPLQETAHMAQLPALLGVASEGEAVVVLNLALVWALFAFAAGLWLLPKLIARLRNRWQNLAASALMGAAVYAIAAFLGQARVETLLSPTKLNTSFIIAILAAICVYYFLWRTKWGYELRAVGVSPKAAEYGGANIARNTILTMTISGALAGLTACHYVLGGALEEYSLRQALPTNDGFDGIAVALLGGNTPLGVVLAAFLFGVLKNGGTILNVTFTGLTRDVVSMILALVVLFIAARGFLPESITNPLKRKLAPEPKSTGEDA
jgi:simple sugar transport system permease protein